MEAPSCSGRWFIGVSRGIYFSRNGDVFFRSTPEFLFKARRLLQRDKPRAYGRKRIHVALVVSGKVADSIARNKIRRRMRCILSSLDSEFTLPVDHCLIFRVRSRLDEVNYAELSNKMREVILAFLRRIGASMYTNRAPDAPRRVTSTENVTLSSL